MSKKFMVLCALLGAVLALGVGVAMYVSASKSTTAPSGTTLQSAPAQNAREVPKAIQDDKRPGVDAMPSVTVSPDLATTGPSPLNQKNLPDTVAIVPNAADAALSEPTPKPVDANSPTKLHTREGGSSARGPQEQQAAPVSVTQTPTPPAVLQSPAAPAPAAPPKPEPETASVVVSAQRPSQAALAQPEKTGRGNSLTIKLPKRQQ